MIAPYNDNPDSIAYSSSNEIMKVYQLVAVGNIKLTGVRHIVYSKKAYRTHEAAKEAIPEFINEVTTPKEKNDLMVMTDNPLRVFVEPLEVV